MAAPAAATGYWSAAMGGDVRPTWKHMCIQVQAEPLAIVGRSRVGKQMVCAGERSVHLFMFYNGGWAFVGGPLLDDEGVQLSPEGLNGVQFVEGGASVEDLPPSEEARVLLLFSPVRNREGTHTRPMRVGVLNPVLHARRGDPAKAFAWVWAVPRRRALAAGVNAAVEERAAHVRAALGGALEEYLRLDGAAEAPDEVRFLDFVPVVRLRAESRPKLQGRPRFSADTKDRAARSASLSEAQEVLCMGLLVAVLCTAYEGQPCEAWRVDWDVQALYRQTEGHAVLQGARALRGSRVAQLRRWLGFCRQLWHATDGFRRAVAEGGAAQALAGAALERPAWAVRRAPPVSAFVHAWAVEGGRAAAPVFRAARGAWPTAGLTAREWMQRHFVALRLDAERARRDGEEEDHPECGPAPAAAAARGTLEAHMAQEVLEPLLVTLRHMQQLVVTKVHAGIEVGGSAKAERTRGEHLARVQALFQGLGQNVATHMRNCRGVAHVARKLEAVITRADGVAKDNERVLQELRVAAGGYADEVGDVEALVVGAVERLNGLARMDLAVNLGRALFMREPGSDKLAEELGVAVLCRAGGRATTRR